MTPPTSTRAGTKALAICSQDGRGCAWGAVIAAVYAGRDARSSPACRPDGVERTSPRYSPGGRRSRFFNVSVKLMGTRVGLKQILSSHA